MSDFKTKMHGIIFRLHERALRKPIALLQIAGFKGGGATSKGSEAERREWREGRVPSIFCGSTPMSIFILS